ncbi:interleukin-11 isoform X2 [Chanodichthys erythropterus]|uniref:interleukin-11 isoform X2 n=1 Tax=Chanodichthys erythropterus TaxID=933992 RepID=UPI00351E932A
MKLLGDSSSSLLLSLLLAQLHLLASAFPAHPRRIQPDFDKLTNQTRHLLKLTQDLLDPVFGAEIDHHRFKSLPAISSRVSDLTSLEFKPTLSQLHADLKSFEHHFEWLNKITRKQHQSSVPKLTDMISHIKILINSLQRQMTRAEAPRIPVPSPSLPPTPAFHWEVVQSSQELLQQFRLFCDWASRVFLTLKSRLPA